MDERLSGDDVKGLLALGKADGGPTVGAPLDRILAVDMWADPLVKVGDPVRILSPNADLPGMGAREGRVVRVNDDGPYDVGTVDVLEASQGITWVHCQVGRPAARPRLIDLVSAPESPDAEMLAELKRLRVWFESLKASASYSSTSIVVDADFPQLVGVIARAEGRASKP